MCKVSQENRTITLLSASERARLEAIREHLRRGDISLIAEREGKTREWVSIVINGRGIGEPILQAAEQLIRERESPQRMAAGQ